MTYRVELKRSWENNGYKYPVGTIIQTDKKGSDYLISSGTGLEFKGEYPPREKRRINLKQLI